MTTFWTKLSGATTRLLAMLAVTALVLQGCVAGVTNEAGDNCVPLRAGLERQIERYNENIAGQAAAGALVGGLIGGIAAGAVGGDVGVGLLLGALAGGIGGAQNAYFQNKQQQFASNIELRQAISSDIGQASGLVRTVSNDVTRLNQCRLRQIADLRAQVQAVGNGPAQRQQLADIRRRMAQDQELIGKVVGDVSAGNALYADAYAQSRSVSTTSVAVRSANYTPRIQGGTRSSRPASASLPPAGRVIGQAYANASSNVRAGPSTNTAVVGGVARGQRIDIVSGTPGQGWVEIAFGGRRAYVAGRLLQDERPRVRGTRSAPSAPASPAADDLPVVQVSSRPPAANEADALLLEAKDLEAGSQAQAAYLEDELSSVEALLE